VRSAKLLFAALSAAATLLIAAAIPTSSVATAAHRGRGAAAPIAKIARAHAAREHKRSHSHLGCRRPGKSRHRHHCATGTRRHSQANAQAVVLARAPAPAPTTKSATIASVLATPCAETEVTPTAANSEAVQAATLCLVNQERARNGELPLSVNPQLAAAAQLHSEDMTKGDYFAHVSPSGETPLERVSASGYIPSAEAGYTIGENIAWGTLYLATPSAIVAAWIASPEHLANILSGAYKDTAIAVVAAVPPSLATDEPGATYTEEFGVLEA
jgi:uncharacterized protein YkwD